MDQREGWEQRQMQGWSGDSAAPSITPEQLAALLQAAGLSDATDVRQGYAQIQQPQSINASTTRKAAAPSKSQTAPRSTAAAKRDSADKQAVAATPSDQVPLSAYTDGAMPSSPTPNAPAGVSLPSDVTAAIAAAIAMASGGMYAMKGNPQAPTMAGKSMQAVDPVLEGELMPKDAASMSNAITGNAAAKRITADGTIKAGAPEQATNPAIAMMQKAGMSDTAPLDMATYRDLIQRVLQEQEMNTASGIMQSAKPSKSFEPTELPRNGERFAFDPQAMTFTSPRGDVWQIPKNMSVVDVPGGRQAYVFPDGTHFRIEKDGTAIYQDLADPKMAALISKTAGRTKQGAKAAARLVK